MGSDGDIESAARVSYGDGTRKVTQTRGLVRYLRSHAHTTPSEMVELKFHCSMPLFVARQWIRHRTASVNEISARYSILPLRFYMPLHEHFAYQDQMNKQGRDTDADIPAEVYKAATEQWAGIRAKSSHAYGWLLEKDVARELARIDLPLSTYTEWYWKIDLHNLLHFLRLRVDSHAQWEIQQYGRVMAGMLQRVAPLSYEAWLDYEVMGARFSAGELEVLQKLLWADPDENMLHASEGIATQKDFMAAGLANREAREFLSKLSPRERPDFSLDLSKMRTAMEVEAGRV